MRATGHLVDAVDVPLRLQRRRGRGKRFVTGRQRATERLFSPFCRRVQT